LSGVLIVAVLAGKVKLTAPAKKERFAGLEEGLCGPVNAHVNRQAT
jgi:hypothetical protein